MVPSLEHNGVIEAVVSGLATVDVAAVDVVVVVDGVVAVVGVIVAEFVIGGVVGAVVFVVEVVADGLEASQEVLHGAVIWVVEVESTQHLVYQCFSFRLVCGGGVWRWCVAVVCGGGVWRWCVAVVCGGGGQRWFVLFSGGNDMVVVTTKYIIICDVIIGNVITSDVKLILLL